MGAWASNRGRRWRSCVVAVAACALGAGCGGENGPAPAAPAVEPGVTVAYDVAVDDVVSSLLAGWSATGGQVMRAAADDSVAISLDAGAAHDRADVLIVTSQTRLAEGERAPVATRRWLRDPLVFVMRAGEARGPGEALMDEEARVAMAHEAGAMGQFTRFGLRKLDRWELVKDRALQFGDTGRIVEAVRDGRADLGVVYASELVEHSAGVEDRGELEVSETANRSYVLVTNTAEGAELARWLGEAAQVKAAGAFGLRADTPLAGADGPVKTGGGEPE